MKRLLPCLLALLLALPQAAGATALAPATGVVMPKAQAAVALHEGTGPRDAVLGRYAAGVAVVILAQDGDWLRVRIGQGAASAEGWMQAGNVGIGILPREAPTGIALATVAPTGGVQAQAQPAEGAPTLGLLPQGAVVESLGSQAGFAHVRVDEAVYGFVPEAALSQSGALSQPDTRQPRRAYGVVMAAQAGGRVPVYAFAQPDADVQLLAADQTGLEVLGGSADWLQVRQYGVTGFMRAEYVAAYALEDYTPARHARGRYTVGADEGLPAGLYTFVAEGAGDTLDVYTAAGTHRRFAPDGPAYYALYLPDGAVAALGGGTLRAACATDGGIPGEDWRLRAQGRYLVGRDVPEGRYAITPNPGAEQAAFAVATLRTEEGAAPYTRSEALMPGTSTIQLLQSGTFIELDGCQMERSTQ